MEVIKHMFRDMRRVNNKKALVAAVFGIAVVAALGLGLSTRANVQAASVRDSGHNPIINTGSVGCLTAKECISDMRKNNPSDLQKIYAHFGLAPSEYERFEKTAKMGVTMRNGDVIVDGQKVITNAWSTGRDKFGKDSRIAYTIPGAGTYYKSQTNDSFADGVKSLDTLVMFNTAGIVETAIITACGNPVWGDNATPSYSCNKLNKQSLANDKYRFTTDTTAIDGAKVLSVTYHFNDGTDAVTVANADKKFVVDHKFPVGTADKEYNVTVSVTVELPGGNRKTFTGEYCNTKVIVKAPIISYACSNLTPKTIGDKKQQYGFTAKATYSAGATPTTADFTADGVTVTGVAMNGKDTFYKEYTFTDTATHTVSAKIHFTVNGKDVVSTQTCEAKVSSEKTPVCIVKGNPYPNEQNPYGPNDERCREECKPGIPVGDERCNPTPECKPGIPEGDDRCKDTPVEEIPPATECKPGVPTGSADCVETPVVTPTPPVMPNTGAGSLVGIFAGTSILGAAGHRMFRNRASRKN